MTPNVRGAAAATALLIAMTVSGTSFAQKPGGFSKCTSGTTRPYCNPEVDQLIEQQSREGKPERHKPILREIERRLATDVARPILFYASGAICRQPWVKG
jgi:hypothetical protein